MVAFIKPESLLLPDNKYSIYFDVWMELSSKGCNAQVVIYLTFAIK